MKQTLFAFMALAMAFAATSCQSDEEFTQQPTNKPMVINAVAEGIGTGTRATMAYKYDILWSENDQIYVTGNSKNATFTLETGQGTANGTFACQSSTFASGEEVEAYYPASLVKDGNPVWPAQQTTSTVVPMYSKNKIGGNGTENFSFASLGAMLQIVFTTPQADVTLKSITIKDDDATMSGTFTVDESGKANITATDKAGIILDLGEGVAVSNKIQYFNIAVPAGTYSKLSITFTATDESTCTFTGSNVTINHNTVGKLTLTGSKFKLVTTGKAKATIGEESVDVNWVQLWKNGPKFAEYNVGASSVTETGTTMTFTDAIKAGAEYVWGANWCTPSKDDLEHLMRAAQGNTDDKVNCEYIQEDGKWGFKFTGLTDGYTDNSVFFPAQKGNGGTGEADYWSATVNDSGALLMYLYYECGEWHTDWNTGDQDYICLVRPVLKN